MRGFSLVELSIVLVILGLLTGGILTGQSLIRAAELRGITAEYAKYAAAIRTFQEKYNAIPGDMTRATLFWGKGSACTSPLGNAAIPGTCNGNGNGNLSDTGTGVSTFSELYMIWQHLSLAGLIEGTYTGLTDSVAISRAAIIEVNVPPSRMSLAGWSISDWANTSGDAAWVNMGGMPNSVSRLYFGRAVTGNWTYGAALRPEEAWNIDTKIDDGKPTAGRLRAVWIANCTTAAGGTDPAINTAEYKVTSSAVACALMFDNNGSGFFTM